MTDPVIAVIDHDPSFLGTINETLAQSGYIAILSQGDHETLRLIRWEHPSLIIIDSSICAQSEESSLVRSIIAEATVHHIPMLITVPQGEEVATDRDWPAPGCVPIAKPIDPDDLKMKMGHALGPVALVAGRA